MAVEAAEIVKRIRAQSGVTRKELAKLANLSPSTVGRIERGELDPTWGTLMKILESTGLQINGETIVSSGDTSAIAAARPVFEEAFAPVDAAQRAFRGAIKSTDATAPATAAAAWWDRWKRTGWISSAPGTDNLLAIAVSVGNAAKVSRREVNRRTVTVDGGWQSLAKRFKDERISYAVSGIVATRKDRAEARAINPLIYVADLREVTQSFNLNEAQPGRGITLIEAHSGELDDVETEDGLHFVSPAQAILDAFAGPGREPDKAEDMLQSMLETAP